MSFSLRESTCLACSQDPTPKALYDTSTDVVKKPLVFHIVVPLDLLRGRGR